MEHGDFHYEAAGEIIAQSMSRLSKHLHPTCIQTYIATLETHTISCVGGTPATSRPPRPLGRRLGHGLGRLRGRSQPRELGLQVDEFARRVCLLRARRAARALAEGRHVVTPPHPLCHIKAQIHKEHKRHDKRINPIPPKK